MKPYFFTYFTVAFISLQAFANAQSVSLGGADSFSVLGGSTVTNTGPTIITGNVGVSPGSAITGFPPGTIVNGAMFTGAASLAGQARADTITAFNSIAALPPTINLSGQDLGGLILVPGVYKFNTSAQLTGVLTLNTGGNPNAPFYFQIGSTLTTAAASSIITLGAIDKNIFFQVGSSATLGLNTAFVGNILAQSSITLTTGASIQGRALAISGAVTLDSNAITNAAFLNGGGPVTVAVTPTDTLVSLAVIALPNGPLIVVPVQDSFRDIPGLTPNQESVATALDKLFNHDPNSPLIANLDTVKREFLAGDYNFLSPLEFAGIFDAGFASAQMQSSNIELRLENIRDGSAENPDSEPVANDTHGIYSGIDAKDGKRMLDSGKTAVNVVPDRRWGFYITGSGGWGDTESTSNAPGSDFKTGAVTVGADFRATDHFVLGLTCGYSNSRIDGADGGKIDLNNGNANAYASWYSHGFYVNGIIGGGYSSYLTRRETIGGVARGNPDGEDYSGLIGTGYEIRRHGFTFGPIAAIQYTTIGLNGFTERGSLAPLRIGDQSENGLLSRVGVRASYAWKVGHTVITPEVRAQWGHEFQDSSRGIGASLAADPAASFNVHGPQVGRDSLILDVGASVQWSPRTSLFGYYTGDLGAANYVSHSVNCGLRIDF